MSRFPNSGMIYFVVLSNISYKFDIWQLVFTSELAAVLRIDECWTSLLVCPPRHCQINRTARGSFKIYCSTQRHFWRGAQDCTWWDIGRVLNLFIQKYFDPTNEPSQQIPFMYHYANRPGESVQRSRRIIAEYFTTYVSGLPGNDGMSFCYPKFHVENQLLRFWCVAYQCCLQYAHWLTEQ